MTLTEAVDALLCALSSDSPAGLLVPQMGDPVHILDLAKFLIGQKNEVPIVFTELRPGDKMEESLISARESYQNVPSGMLCPVHTPTLSPDELSAPLDALRLALQQHDLPALLHAVQRIVPEYHPSLPLREHLYTSSTVTVSV
jgi:dTDP-glucose 4,6-dehydratase